MRNILGVVLLFFSLNLKSQDSWIKLPTDSWTIAPRSYSWVKVPPSDSWIKIPPPDTFYLPSDKINPEKRIIEIAIEIKLDSVEFINLYPSGYYPVVPPTIFQKYLLPFNQILIVEYYPRQWRYTFDWKSDEFYEISDNFIVNYIRTDYPLEIHRFPFEK